MALPIKTYWASLAHTIFEMDKYLTKHQTTLVAVATIVSPVDVPAVVAAIASIHTFAVLFEKIHSLVDPFAPPDE